MPTHGTLTIHDRRKCHWASTPPCSTSAAATASSTPITAATPSSSAATPKANPPAPRSSAPAPLPMAAPSRAWLPVPARPKAASGLPAAAAPDALLLTESAVDALSALLLLAPALPPDTLVASTAGVAAALPRWLQAFHAPQTLCAYDADPAGDLAADALRLHTPNFSRLRPVGAKDCNDLLRRSPSP